MTPKATASSHVNLWQRDFKIPTIREKSIRFAMSQAGNQCVVIGFTNPDQIDEAIHAG